MGDHMRPVPFRELVARIFEEYAADRSIFSLPQTSFFRKQGDKRVSLFGQWCETPLGPAAGPHTQLAQNIVTSYLAGSRFIELKTVQEKEPPVDKPCIDAEDEGFNTEWSSEYTVEKAYDEYIKAWLLLHLLEEAFELRTGSTRSFLFNMSVGYNLTGIQTPRMDTYINSLMDASKHAFFNNCLDELSLLLKDGSFLKHTGLESRLSHLRQLPDRIEPHICKSVTLSTMHGCPPAEIEKICAYMLTEKNLETYVKLNPTLLSFPVVRTILDKLGFDYITLSEESFHHDLAYSAAIPMLRRLQKLAAGQGRFFGVKLTNTLGSVNFKKKLPGGEMYMSGRSLFPLSMQLSAKICHEFNGQLPISFSAGISEHNVADVFATGIRPITLATDLLKPGGYNRMSAIATKLEQMDGWDQTSINVGKVADLAEKALSADYAQKYYRGSKKVTVAGSLPLYDCAEAPCKMACPIGQDIPEYIRLVGEERYAEALALIYEKNALPSITGHICDHACQYNCTRLDYEGAVLIREAKRIAVVKGYDEYRQKWALPAKQRGVKAAVLGAGPGGLAAAYFLAKEGFDVTVFEQRDSAGGTPRHIIPQFRMSSEAVASDVNFIKDHGVRFIFNCDPNLTIDKLRAEGYQHIIIAVGAGAEKPFPLQSQEGCRSALSALEFLDRFNHQPESLQLGKHVAVIGAGNTAMDASRTALRLPGVESCTVIYRRTQKEMPAYHEEYELALADNVQFHFLLNPEQFQADGKLVCRVMKLGEPDASGRRKPEPTDELRTLPADTVITAIGEDINTALLQKIGVTGGALPGVYVVGDALNGPASIVQAIADARKATTTICQSADTAWQPVQSHRNKATTHQVEEIANKKYGLTWQSDVKIEGDRPADASVGKQEFARCLECSYVCNKCVEVCPNRANLAIAMNADSFANFYQIVHLDAYCNECGNCATFCPWDGRPYTDKITLFSLRQDFENSRNPGFLAENNSVRIRCGNELYTYALEQGRLRIEGNTELSKLAAIFNELYSKRPALFGPVDE
jgi:putative selenate reductase